MSARLESRFSWRLLVDTVTDEVSLGEETGAEMAPSTCTFMFEYLVASLSERVKLEPNFNIEAWHISLQCWSICGTVCD